MKRIQQGFTLIELMIVVAIIGILAAVAIPAYQDYIVKAKLSKVVSTLDPVKTALAMYFQEQGGFPVAAASDSVTTANQGTVATQGSVWASLGFGNFPSLPNEVATMSLHAVPTATTSPASNIAVVLTLTNIKVGTINGAWVALSPNQISNSTGAGTVYPTSATSTNLTTTETISGASAIQWFYGCNKGANSATDGVVKNFFKNGNVVLTCA